MFNLIITIISIALVVAMAAAAVYYGGEAFTNGTAKANAATLVTQAQQLNGAITMFKNDNGGSAPASVGDLTYGGEYLQSAPIPGSAAPTGAWTLTGGNSVITGVGSETCIALNNASGHAEDAAVGPATLTTAVYGCTASGTLTYRN